MLCGYVAVTLLFLWWWLAVLDWVFLSRLGNDSVGVSQFGRSRICKTLTSYWLADGEPLQLALAVKLCSEPRGSSAQDSKELFSFIWRQAVLHIWLPFVVSERSSRVFTDSDKSWGVFFLRSFITFSLSDQLSWAIIRRMPTSTYLWCSCQKLPHHSSTWDGELHVPVRSSVQS